ncbi:MAG: hypothetical protein IJ557_02685 [Bacteroidaceae bacterium]|nr:hypothetical protein [Bacteroidaceae bacterium]
MKTKERIDLHLPTSWAACTVEELEQIVIAKRMSVLFNWQHDNNDGIKAVPWKVECFLRLAELEMLQGPHPEVPVEEQYIVVQRIASRTSRCSWFPWENKKKNEPFVIYLWQVHYWIKEFLGWLDTPPKIIKFPYPIWCKRWHKFAGPSIYLTNWSWTQYRIAQDYLQYYIVTAERLSKKIGTGISDEERRKLIQQLQTARALFLATIYNKKVTVIDEETLRKKKGYYYLANQSSDNNKYFRDYSTIKFEVILLWWGYTMQRLHQIYPKCFASDKKKTQPKKQQDSLELYSRLTATMEKYMRVDEKQLGKETFSNVLQHLNDMVANNEELERIRNRHK